MRTTIIFQEGYDISLTKKDDEHDTECYCSVCGKYLGGKSFAYRVFNSNMEFCKYCGAKLN